MIGLEDQRHSPSLQLGIALHLAHQRQLALDLLEDVAPQVHVGHFAAAELQRELHLVSFLEELAGVVDLDQKIMIANLHGSELELLELPGSRRSARLVFLLLLLVAPLAVVHDAADRRARGRGDLDEIEAGLACEAQRLRGGDNSNLFFVLINQADGRDANLLVVTEVGRNSRTLLKKLLC